MALARNSLEEFLARGAFCLEQPDDHDLWEPRGAFVTLTLRGLLRGCIGFSEPTYPLYEAVANAAVASASRDSRFAPVTSEELPEIRISISALSPMSRISSPEQIEIGRHGLLVSGAGRRGLLLPQVASEHAWDRESFLRHTCVKAGLAPDGWKHPAAELLVFEAEVFGED
jgi:hypothetical protein